MAAQTYPISNDGLALNVLIGLKGADMAALVAAGKPVPAPALARALVDTGTDVTCCAKWVLQRFGLVPMLQHTTQTASGSASVRLFEVSLSIPGATSASGPLFVLPQLVVMELPQPLQNVEVLIGLDVLLQCVLHVDGPGRQFSLSV
jgi:hypothetical protein